MFWSRKWSAYLFKDINWFAFIVQFIVKYNIVVYVNSDDQFWFPIQSQFVQSLMLLSLLMLYHRYLIY